MSDEFDGLMQQMTSSRIVERRDARTVKSKQTIYELDGPLDRECALTGPPAPRTAHAAAAPDVSPVVLDKFAEGFPESWQDVVQNEFDAMFLSDCCRLTSQV